MAFACTRCGRELLPVNGLADPSAHCPDGRELHVVRGDTVSLCASALAPDGKSLALGNRRGEIRVFDVAPPGESSDYLGTIRPEGVLPMVQIVNRKNEPLGGFGKQVVRANLTPDGSRILTDLGPGFEVFDASSRNSLCLYWGGDAALSPDARQVTVVTYYARVKDRAGRDVGSWVGNAHPTVETFDVATGKVVRIYRCEAVVKRLATGSFDRTVRLWNPASGEEFLTLRGHRGAVLCVSFSSDGHRLLSGGQDGVLKVWDGRPLDK